MKMEILAKYCLKLLLVMRGLDEILARKKHIHEYFYALVIVKPLTYSPSRRRIFGIVKDALEEENEAGLVTFSNLHLDLCKE